MFTCHTFLLPNPIQLCGGGFLFFIFFRNMLFVSSIGGYTPLKNLGVYSITKTALIGLTKTLSEELGEYGVRVNALAPGIIATKFSKMLYEEETTRNELLKTVPLNRLGTTSEMGATAAFLCSEDASYITGEVMVASGGMHSHL
eukprot:m.48614 g.48614  ORF g.48614 m.48614 type:complete len:144 (-) comp7406_c0_seq3:1757-2188(-)